MNESIARAQSLIDALRASWPATLDGAFVDVDDLTQSQTMVVHRTLIALRRQVDALTLRLAVKIDRESRPELGSEGLARKCGYRNAVALIAATTATSSGEAARLVAVGKATAPRMTFSGAATAAQHPHVAAAIDAGHLSPLAAHAIITMLDRIALRCSWEEADAAEQALCAQAADLTVDQLAKVITRAEAHLDPDGVEPREHELRAARSLRMFERDGMLHLNATLDAETAAPVKTAIEAYVTAEFRAARKESGMSRDGDPDVPARTVHQRQADALAALAAHALGCDGSELPLDDTTVIVRMSLEDLDRGRGHATIDGLAQPVSIATARRIAARSGIIPAVLDSHGEVLDWGRRRRLFTKAQRLAIAERDGGCAACGLPPGMTKVHHIRWGARDAGPTDLANGVLLCESCHHRIHDDHWEIRIDRESMRSRVWFIPPPHVDPERTPRLGSRAKFDHVV